MKSALVSLFFLAAVALPASATVSINYQFGVAFDTQGVAVPDGAMWAIVGDTNANGTFPGGFTTNASIVAALATEVSNSFHPGQSIAVGSVIDGDTVFAMGAFNGTAQVGIAGISLGVLLLALGPNGVESGQNFAFYWFPDRTYVAGTNTIGYEIGGINTLVDDVPGGLGPMTIGADGSAWPIGAATPAVGGWIPDSRFTAIDLLHATVVPEPSAALLGALGGVVGLLRRRRASAGTLARI